MAAAGKRARNLVEPPGLGKREFSENAGTSRRRLGPRLRSRIGPFPACSACRIAFKYAALPNTIMNIFRPLIIGTASFILAAGAHAQNPPATKPAGGTPPTGAAKAKPFSAGDTHIYLTIAEAIQFQLNMSLRVRGKYKDGPQDLLDFAAKISKESTELWTPSVDIATSHGVDGKKIPNDLTKADKANLAKLGTIKDEKKWQLAFFEFYAKESKKNAHDAETAAKAAQDPDLKAFAEKATALFKSQDETIEAKSKELKTRK